MRKRKRLLSLFLSALLLCSALPLSVAATEPSALIIGTAEGLRGATVTVDISLTGVNGIASGGFTITYDNSNLSVDGAEAGAVLSDCTLLINTDYSSNAIRVSFMGTTALPSAGTLVSIRFKIKDNAALGNYQLTASNVKFSDINANIVSREAENGSIAIRGVSVLLSSAEIASGQGFDLDLYIQPPIAPCAGTMTLQYDSASLSCGQVTPVQKMGNTPVTLQYSVDAQKGTIDIGWMAGEPITAFGKLCSIHFESNKQSFGTQNISFTNYQFVDKDGLVLPCEAPQKAVITIAECLENLPKLYFSGGSLDETSGIVTIRALVDGAELACAGNAKILYDTSDATLLSVDAKYSGLVVTPEQPESADGCIQIAWMSADPLGENISLVEFKFQLEKTAKSDLTFSDACLCDKNGLFITQFNLENTEIFGQKQWARITEVSTGAEKSILNIRLDESIPSSAKMLLAAYDVNGRFVGVHICTAEETIAAKTANGAEVSFVQAKSKKLFLLATDGSPLFGSIEF